MNATIETTKMIDASSRLRVMTTRGISSACARTGAGASATDCGARPSVWASSAISGYAGCARASSACSAAENRLAAGASFGAMRRTDSVNAAPASRSTA